MTGRDLVNYILENHLEDEPIIKPDGTIIGFIKDEQVAVKKGIGSASVYAMFKMGMFEDSYQINGHAFIFGGDLKTSN